jgi:AcrR family transcriptional regulator
VSESAATAGQAPGLRAITRQAVRSQIAATAMTLFVRHGFEETTVEQVAAAVGISGRSVFRYFSSKEEMVLDSLNEIGDHLAAALDARPSDEPAWQAVRRAMDDHLNDLNNDDGSLLAISAMLDSTPSLQAALAAKRARWSELLVPGITRRLEAPKAMEAPRAEALRQAIQARALAIAALGCLSTAVDEWARTGGTARADKLVDLAIAAVRQ